MRDKTINYYDQEPEKWVETHGGNQGQSYYENFLQERFHALLPKGKVLELGSGGGKDAAALINLGYNYTGTDASSGLLKVAQERNPEGKFLHLAINELDQLQEDFDGFWAAAVLLHIPKDEIDSAMQNIRRKIKIGGIGFISLKEGDGEKEDKDTGRWFAFYREPEFREIAERNGFEIVEIAKKEESRSDKPTWLLFFVKAI